MYEVCIWSSRLCSKLNIAEGVAIRLKVLKINFLFTTFVLQIRKICDLTNVLIRVMAITDTSLELVGMTCTSKLNKKIPNVVRFVH